MWSSRKGRVTEARQPQVGAEDAAPKVFQRMQGFGHAFEASGTPRVVMGTSDLPRSSWHWLYSTSYMTVPTLRI